MTIPSLRPSSKWILFAFVVAALASVEQIRLWAQACSGLTLTIADSPDPVSPGGALTYTINLSRSTPLLNATLTDVLPAGVQFQSLVSPAGTTCTTPAVGGTGTVTCTFNYDPDRIYAITSSNLLMTFASHSPGILLSAVPVTGLQSGEVLLGIDLRPATQTLYGVGSTSRLYQINTTTGAATQVGTAGSFTLNGTSFGVDFNPVVDRLRVVSDFEQNIRINPDTGALAATDTPLTPPLNVVAAAYTNNVAGAIATTLYVIDSLTDELFLLGSINGTPTSPNSGVLTAVGPLGVDTSEIAGFDISPSGTAYALLTVGGATGEYTINLATGAATLVGFFPPFSLTDIAVAPSVSLTYTFTLTGTVASSVTLGTQINNTVTVSSSSEPCSTSATATTTVPCPTITVSPSSVSAGTVGNAYPTTTFTQSGGNGTATFLSIGTLPPGLALSSAGVLSGTPTTAGTFDFMVIATDVNGCTGSRNFSVTINPTPTLTLTPSTVNFGVINSAGTITAVTPGQTLTLLQNGPGTVTWTAVSDVSWLSVSPASGSGPGAITATITSNPALLPAPGAATSTVTVTAVGSANSPTATVNLTVLTPDQAGPPIGFIDSPSDGQSNVTGAIAVTGWALDDVGVTQVQIFRTSVTPENPNQLIFVGNGVFVSGARPDVAAIYPTKPLKDQAGWGYMLLTNALPNQGNGTFTLYAYATDVEGRSALLGFKTITCTNATATAPFGTIDTPTQGGMVSGTAFVNFGWVLTPQPKMIPIDGSTINVLIDSMTIGTVTYNLARSDIQQTLPGYKNTDGAVGYRIIDTTQLSNGVHTIAWIATDDGGITSGIGSRYFTVANSGSSLVLDATPSSSTVIRSNAAIADNPPILAPVDPRDVRQYRVVQLERLEVNLGDGARPGVTYRGYGIAGDQLVGLPVGSHLDAQSGVFSWAPGLGFGGTHPLVFVRREAGTERQIRIDVVIEAQRVAEQPARVVIDIPSAGAAVGQPFLVAGWAFDPAGPATGTGLDVLHVWAHPVDGSAPRFIGVAAYGGARPDVAAVFGARFLQSGFGVRVAGLPAGTYDIVVYGFSLATGQFSVTGAVRVTVR
ncbi:MAG TPA: DUF4394 domain-containing protein [Vicinamibacterales bacterium]|nr:DUF4394 domain-containing protein [Vicinamibacterales bacterium]